MKSLSVAFDFCHENGQLEDALQERKKREKEETRSQCFILIADFKEINLRSDRELKH